MIVLVSISLIVAGIYNLKNYFQDRAAEKTQVTALIVKDLDDPDDQLLKFEFNGKTYYGDPADKILHNYGKLGDKVKIYVQTNRPQRVFMLSTARGEATVGTLLLGWGILLALIVWAERRILQILGRAKIE